MNDAVSWGPDEEVRLGNYLADSVIAAASGRAADECLFNLPRDQYFVGSLRPREEEDEANPRFSSELLNKLAPTALGMDVRARTTGGRVRLRIKLAWSAYYRVFPEYAQQAAYQQRPVAPTSASSEEVGDADSQGAADEASDESEGTDQDAEGGGGGSTGRRSRATDSLLQRFRKIPCSVEREVEAQTGAAGVEFADVSLQAAINEELARAAAVALADPMRLRTSGASEEAVRVPTDVLSSEADFSAHLSSLSNDAAPQWALVVTLGTRAPSRPEEDSLTLFIELENASPRRVTPRGRDSLNFETYVFDVTVHVRFLEGEPLPFELLLAPTGFRYDRELWGRGFNTGVVYDADAREFATVAAPTHNQARFVTREEPTARFDELAADPLPILARVHDAMEEYLAVWDEWNAEYRSRATWSADDELEFSTDRGKYVNEISRFATGQRLVETDSDVELAFRLTNETFARGPNDAWRLFQLVFLVTQIPDIATLQSGLHDEERKMVDIVFFPTGGGKTEAYLAVIVFHCFYDRLRAKRAGVTAWIRFPLRLLTLQQTQRLADVLAAAELVRQAHSDERLSGAESHPFEVGYFVGAEGSPNEIADPASAGSGGYRFGPAWSTANDPVARQAWKRISRCPSCRTRTVQVDFDSTAVRLLHRCTNEACAFPEGRLPIVIVDNEIYRYLPSVLVGTIDKLASVGFQRKLSMVFGRVQGTCSVHGFYFGRCSQQGCTDRTLLNDSVPSGLSGPSLLVQDELHLLKEGLGTFDGHYETFVQELTRQFGNPELKLLASSATIEAFERQVEHLYGRPPEYARVFPGFGPALGESFYARTLPYPQRIFVGVIPHNKTIFNAILEVLELYARVISQLTAIPIGATNPYGGSVEPGTEDWHGLLDYYTTSLVYFLNKRELDSIGNDIAGDLNPNLVSDGLNPLRVLELTSNVSTAEVERTLNHLETPQPGEREADAVLATNMVSHGVDVDRLNAMFFYGMPRQTAEYIQASSRVGRNRCGVVFTCLHPARERDQSHYGYFAKYHEFLGQLVEPVAINRWAAFAMDRTLPGLFMAVLLQIIASSGRENPNSYYLLEVLKRKVADGELQVDTFAPTLEAAFYGPSGDDTSGEIRRSVRQYLDQLVSASPGLTFGSEALIPRPMSSLREVDEQLEVELDAAGSAWAATL